MSKNFELGKEYFDNEDYVKAIEFFSKASEENPNDANPVRMIGLSYFWLDDRNKAFSYYDKAISIDPDYKGTYYSRGYNYWYMQEFTKAIDDFTTAIKLDPKWAIAYTSRGEVYAGALNRYDLALNDFQEALKLKPEDPNAYKNVGFSLFYAGNRVEGLEILLTAVEHNLITADIYYGIGNCYLSLGEYEKAVKYSAMAHKLDPTNELIKDIFESSKELFESGKKYVTEYQFVYDFEKKSYLPDFEGSCKYLSKSQWNDLRCNRYPNFLKLQVEKLPDNTTLASHCRKNICKWDMLDRERREYIPDPVKPSDC